MRVELSGESAGGLCPERVKERLLWAFGSYAAEIQRARVSFRTVEEGSRCDLRVGLRGRGTVEVDAVGPGEEESLRSAARRARRAVSRRLDLKRLLGGRWSEG